MERNVKLFPFFEVLFNSFAWGPVFFLYFAERVPLHDVLELHALYYLAVVILEVPSGYFSDQFGRKVTLLIASTGFVAANTVFYLGFEYGHLASAQILMALGYSFYSGTNSSFHYDSLKQLNREEEFRDREARIAGWELLFGALALVLGGFLATFSLKNAYGLTALTSVGALVLALFFREPNQEEIKEKVIPFFQQLKLCFQALRDKDLAWVSYFIVLFTVVVHIPSEFFQPYAELLQLEVLNDKSSTPLVVGIIMALGSFFAAGFAAQSSKIAGRWGSHRVFSFVVFVEVALTLIMAKILHVTVFALLLLRRIPESLIRAPYATEVNSRIETRQRATFFSMNSLAGRLSYSVLLYVLSHTYGRAENINAAALEQILTAAGVFGVVGWIVMRVTQRRLG